ncbi:lipase family protein [Methylocystis rosea]|uniref:lipase family protein n=1 Tax=Methylocystis rosea TaxID=173366 RepID=UPI0018DDE76F|nr:lipase family protein [Methylocystis rosea]
MTPTTCSTSQPLSFGDSSQQTFKVCTFLVNMLSNMYEQWLNAGSPRDFDWQPANACPITKDFKVEDYAFGQLIWSTFTLEFKKTVTEPFGCLVKSKTDGSLYLVFRGSKSLADFEVDIEFKPVAYSAPTPNPPPGILVARGWYAVYTGLVEALDAQLKTIGSKPLTITGHSLGSALATLAVPLAASHNIAALHYNSASPMVGLKPFHDYYENLKVQTFRLVNTADTVPNLPPKRSGDYQHVGIEVPFNADYGAEKKTHHPCCSYAYAIYNPDAPCNKDFDACAPTLGQSHE